MIWLMQWVTAETIYYSYLCWFQLVDLAHSPRTQRGRKYEITNAFFAGAFGISMRISVRVSHVLESWWLVLCARETQGDALQEMGRKGTTFIYVCIWEFLLLQGRLHVHIVHFLAVHVLTRVSVCVLLFVCVQQVRHWHWLDKMCLRICTSGSDTSTSKGKRISRRICNTKSI